MVGGEICGRTFGYNGEQKQSTVCILLRPMLYTHYSWQRMNFYLINILNTLLPGASQKYAEDTLVGHL